ncbi:hypothetical protein [Anaeromyxobacter paludicola]|uniref:DUF3618 domain-containing protein n=1 Tax=Anaeromyxobacter paludicola TaxID=2918171 RepID=A0ABM7X603_9BACT|nr:hypothetical protein [Anaeromyxobacter paludicola]BDG07241.1 hypothetical protein AMPC_03540 [Anaeromyxobacter paludicola]
MAQRTEGVSGQLEGMDPADVMKAVQALREQLVEAAARLEEQLELERRMRENPFAVLGIAAGAGFILGGGLWPVLRPFARSLARAATSPANLMALAAAFGAMRASQSGQDEAEPTPPMAPH